MTTVEAMLNERPGADETVKASDQVGVFLAALATVLRETLARFEDTVSRISEIVVTQPGLAGRELVMAFQDFDRLQQEFATLGEVLAHLATTSLAGARSEAGTLHAGFEAIDAIPILELKERLVHHVNGAVGDLAGSTDEAVF